MKGGRKVVQGIPLLLAFLLGAAGAGCKQGPWGLWRSYAAHFIDGQGRVVDPQGGDRTTSEGQSYALFFALVADDRAEFDRVLAWTQSNLASGSLNTHLPGWLWGKAADGQWKTLDVNSASDSDCWIAYSLLEAGRLWNAPAYTETGRRMLAMIAKQEVTELPQFGMMLMPGPTQLWVHDQTWTVNASYLPMFLFDRFAEVDPEGPWSAIAKNVPRVLRQSARRGFAMDWSDYVPGSGFYPAAGPGAGDTGKAAQPAVGSYDAIRVYLWAGIQDDAGDARADLIAAIPGMAAYLGNHGAPPEKVDGEGVPLAQEGPVGFSAALLPYLRAAGQQEKAVGQQQTRMGAQVDQTTGLYGKNPTYYDQNLALFATGFLDGRYRLGAHGELKVEWTRA